MVYKCTSSGNGRPLVLNPRKTTKNVKHENRYIRLQQMLRLFSHTLMLGSAAIKKALPRLLSLDLTDQASLLFLVAFIQKNLRKKLLSSSMFLCSLCTRFRQSVRSLKMFLCLKFEQKCISQKRVIEKNATKTSNR